MSMCGSDRVSATVTKKTAGRRAFSAVLCLYGARLTNCDLKTYYTDAAAYARGQAAVREKFEVDILFSPFAFALIAEAFGSKLRYFDDQPPTVRRPAVQSSKDFLANSTPDIENNPSLNYLREAVRLMAAEHKQAVPIAAVLPSPLDLMPLILGLDAWMQVLLFEQDLALQITETISAFMADLTNALISDGASLAVYTACFLNRSVVGPETIQQVCVPVMEKFLPRLSVPAILHHAGLPLCSSLDLLTDLPNTLGFALDHRDNLDEARKILGNGPLLISGPTGPLIKNASPEEVRQSCDAILKNRRNDPKFILSTCSSDILLGTDPECIHAIRKAVEEFPA